MATDARTRSSATVSRAARAPRSAAAPIPLDPARLANRIAELGLKQWWLAEQIGVDRRTVMRWVNGQVTTLQPRNAARLAGALGCTVEELRPPSGSVPLAGAAEQRAAAEALAEARLLDRLGPPQQWRLAEQLLKATARADLPLPLLGTLLEQLTVACWRQDKLDEAARHNAAALDIAERCGHHALRARALGSRANLRFWRGEIEAALADWRAALALAPWLEPRERGGLHSNLGASLYETGRLDEGRRELQTAVELLDAHGTPMQQAIVRAHLALLALERGDAATARREGRRSAVLARRADYRRGLALAPLLEADTAALDGDAAAVPGLIAESRAAFAALGIREALNERLAARALRRIGQFDEAAAALATARALAAGFPLELAAVEAEAAALGAAARG